MKNTIKQIGVIVLVAVIGFSMAACNNGGSSGSGNNNDNNNNNTTASGYSISGDTLTLSGQVYELTGKDWVEDPGNIIITKCNDSFNVYIDADYNREGTVKGTVKNGQLSVSMGKPNVNMMVPITYFSPFLFFGRGFHYDLTSSETNVNIYGLELSEKYYGKYDAMLYSNLSGNAYGFTVGFVHFLYADKDVNIRANGTTEFYDGYDDEEDVYYSGSAEYSDVNLSLKAGWNVVYSKETYSEYSEGIQVIVQEKYSLSQTIPSGLRWILYDL